MPAANGTVWQFIMHKTETGHKTILLQVTDSKGSSPGRKGFSMAVSDDGHVCGTIGGGIMEHKFVELARSSLASGTAEWSIHRQVHSKQAEKQSGMICSGEQTILLYPVKNEDVRHIARLLASLENQRNGSLVITESGIHFEDAIPTRDFNFNHNGTSFYYNEKTGLKNVINIIGGGHCSLALSELMRNLDFYIKVYDDRPGLSTMERNVFAHEKTVVPGYEHLKELIPGGPSEYAVIMTLGYRTDDLAFRTICNKPFRYLGMLGSKSKIKTMADTYGNETPGKIMDHIYAPVGLDIKSETAYEIAVSIAAQIIKVKNYSME